jgi:hypothetical protein
METSFGKMVFGDNLLVFSRNIASKEALCHETSRKCYINFRKQLADSLRDGSLTTLTGYDQSSFSDEYLEKLEYEYTEERVLDRGGICFSEVLCLMGKIIADGHMELIVEHAQLFAKGAPPEVAALHAIYKEMEVDDLMIHKNHDCYNWTVRENLKHAVLEIIIDHAQKPLPEAVCADLELIIDEIMAFYMEKKNTVQMRDIFGIFKDTLMINYMIERISARQSGCEVSQQRASWKQIASGIKDFKFWWLAEFAVNNAMAHLYGFKQDFEGTGLASQKLDNFRNFPNSRLHLAHFNALSAGFYQISFSTLSSHAIFYGKDEDGQGYIFDPNLGLIQCAPFDHSLMFLKLLNMYPPPSKRLPNEDEERNYRVTIVKYNKINR